MTVDNTGKATKLLSEKMTTLIEYIKTLERDNPKAPVLIDLLGSHYYKIVNQLRMGRVEELIIFLANTYGFEWKEDQALEAGGSYSHRLVYKLYF